MTYQLLKVESRGICRQWGEWHEKDSNHHGRKWRTFHSVQLERLVDERGRIGGYAPCHRPKLHVVIRSIYKDGLLTVSEVQQKQEISKGIWQTLYGLPMIVALCFRINSYGAARFRDIIFKRLYGAKEKSSVIILQLYGGTTAFS